MRDMAKPEDMEGKNRRKSARENPDEYEMRLGAALRANLKRRKERKSPLAGDGKGRKGG